MDVIEVCSAVSNETRLRLVKILAEEGAMSSKRAHEEYVRQHDARRRESIYKALETLVDAGVLTKYYDREGDGITYDVAVEKLLIDLTAPEVEEVDS